MRLINADNLKKDIAKLHVLHDEKEIRRLYYANPHTSLADFEEILVRIFDAIEAAPTIDAVEVVRCKDCKYFEFDSWAKVNEIPIIVAHEICKFWGSGCGCKTDSDGYCSFGERKETDHE